MIIRSHVDPSDVEELEIKCKYCFTYRDFKKEWRMWGKTTKRQGHLGVLEAWSFSCPVCQGHLLVQYWKKTPTDPLPFEYDPQ